MSYQRQPVIWSQGHESRLLDSAIDHIPRSCYRCLHRNRDRKTLLNAVPCQMATRYFHPEPQILPVTFCNCPSLTSCCRCLNRNLGKEAFLMKYKQNVSFVEARRILESYMKVSSYANITQRMTKSNTSQPDRALIETKWDQMTGQF